MEEVDPVVLRGAAISVAHNSRYPTFEAGRFVCRTNNEQAVCLAPNTVSSIRDDTIDRLCVDSRLDKFRSHKRGLHDNNRYFAELSLAYELGMILLELGKCLDEIVTAMTTRTLEYFSALVPDV